MKRLITVFVFFTFFSASVSSAYADSTPAPSTPVSIATQRLDTMLRTGHADPAWFSDSFLSQVPASRVDTLVASLVSSLGAYERIEFTPTKFIAHFAKGTDDVLIHLDQDNKIDGLVFRPPSPSTSSLDDALDLLRSSQGTVSYVITAEGRPDRAAFNADASLAVGSAFKLAVLSALRDQINAGNIKWTDVVPLREEWKSLPTGVLQDWPDGTPLTIAAYAAEMISISDNTAANALIDLDGRSALARYAGSNTPFLTTRQVFVLKSTGSATLRSDYLAAKSPSAARAVLVRVDEQPLPAVDDLLETPLLAIEWHYSVRDLCRMMARVADLPVMSINPGAANPKDFVHIAYKGGSDFGVINLTTMVKTRRGSRYCFSATLNDSDKRVDESAFERAYSAALGKLAAL